MALFTRGISLWHKQDAASKAPIELADSVTSTAFGTRIPGLQEVGELQAGKGNSAGFDKIEVTTLLDAEHKYIDGLKADEGDAESISFTLLYDKDVYAALLGLVAKENNASPTAEFKGSEYFVTIPHAGVELGTTNETNSSFRIRGFSNIKVGSATVNGALNMVLTITPTEEIVFTA